MKKLLTAAAFVLLSLSAVHAEGGVPARQLYSMCTTAKVEFKSMPLDKVPVKKRQQYLMEEVVHVRSMARLQQCWGYLRGFADAIVAQNEVLLAANRSICLPGNVTSGDLQDIFVKSYNGRPDKRHVDATEFVAGALFAAFPCPSNRSS